MEGDHYYHHVGGRLAHPSNCEWGWLERPEQLALPCSPASQEATEALIASIATLPMLAALNTDLCVQGGTVEGDHY